MGEFTDSFGPGGKRSVRDVALGRVEQAKANLSQGTREALPTLSAAVDPAPAPKPEGNFLQRRLQAAEAAAAGGQGGDMGGGDMAMGEPGPAPDPYGDVSSGAYGYGGALQNAQMLDRAYRTVRSDNPMYAPTQDYIGQTKENQIAAADAQQSAYQTQAAKAAEAATLANEAHAQATQMELRQQFMAEQEARRRADIDANLAKYQQAADQAVQDFQRIEKYDPGKAWADKSAGTKIRIALAAFGRGLQGGSPQEVFNDVLQRELAAQKQTRSDAAENLQATRGQVQNALTQRDTFLALAKDERVADAMVQSATMRKIAAKMEAMEAQYGPAIVNDQWRAAKAAADQMITDSDYRLAQIEAATPKYFSRTVSTMGRNERAIRQQMAKEMVGTAGEAQKQGIGAMADQQKAAARDQYGLSDRDWGQVEKYSADESVAKMEGVQRIIDEITAPENIRGVSPIGADWIGDDARDLNGKLRTLKNALGRAESGGAITEDELTMFTDMIESGVESGGGESRLRQNLSDVRQMMEVRLESKRRGLTPEARRYITRQENPDFVGESQRAGHGRKRVQASDGTITTNRSEFE